LLHGLVFPFHRSAAHISISAKEPGNSPFGTAVHAGMALAAAQALQ
jgi:hypothetical protein